MADSPHHSSDVYKHVVHNLSFFDTSSHMPNLDSKEPNLNSVKSPQFWTCTMNKWKNNSKIFSSPQMTELIRITLHPIIQYLHCNTEYNLTVIIDKALNWIIKQGTKMKFLPLSSSPHTYTTWWQQFDKSQCKALDDISRGTYGNHNSTFYHRYHHKAAQQYHKPFLQRVSSRMDMLSSLEEDNLHTPQNGTPSHTHVFRRLTISHRDSHI